MARSRAHRITVGLTRGLVFLVAFVLLAAGAGLATLETSWGKGKLRQLIVGQANQYLTADLEIDRLEGSLFRGLEIVGIRLSRDGKTLIRIERVALSYSIRELIEGGTSVRRLRVVRPFVVAKRQPDGRWDLAALVKRDARQRERSGPGRPIHLLSVEVTDGTIELRDGLRFGAAHVPTRFAALDARLSFDYEPVGWRLELDEMSWIGGSPDLTVERLEGGIASGAAGITFRDLFVQTPRSAFTIDGRIARDRRPTVLDLEVDADRFAFQEWAGVLTGLRNIAVEASFVAKLTGPLARLATDLDMRSTGGDVRGPFVLDTTVPGWRGVGSVQLERLNLARWMNRPDRPSDISGRADFDLDLNLGGVPVGTYAFAGRHAGYLGYEGDQVRARGRIRRDGVQIDAAAADAYGGNVRVSHGSIGFSSPYPFHFQGSADHVDLRLVPAEVPVPHVESLLAFEYDVRGQFSSPFITGSAAFGDSEFLGARISAGASGSIDTSVSPIRYGGEGELGALDLRRFGAGLGVEWMQEPAYAGTLSGRFRVDATGTDPRTMTLTGGGRLRQGDFFEGTLADADVDVRIDQGSLRASYDGRLSRVNPAAALADERFAGSLTGSGRAVIEVRDLFLRSPALTDYEIAVALRLEESVVRGVEVDGGNLEASLASEALRVAEIRLRGPAVEARGSGILAFGEAGESRFEYDVARADLFQLDDLIGRRVRGDLVTKGRLSGPRHALQLAGDAAITRFEAAGVGALSTTAAYEILFPPPERSGEPPRAKVRGRASIVEAFNQTLQLLEGTIAFGDGRLAVDVAAMRSDTLEARIKGDAALNLERRTLELLALELGVQGSAWQLAPGQGRPRVTWDEGGIAVSPTSLIGIANADQRIAIAGTWREDGSGALQLTAARVYLDAFSEERPARYGGVVDAVATLTGGRRPLVRADLTVTDGRVRQLAYQKLHGRVNYADGALEVDMRLDQAPGVWLTAAGTLPLGVFDASLPEQPIRLEIVSSTIGLGLVEGLTSAVRKVTGTVQMNLTVIGTSHDPHFAGSLEVENAGFVVAASGASYRNARASLRMASDVVQVDRLYVEDMRGRALEVRGSLGTHERRVGDLQIDVSAKGFELVRNEFGTTEVDARLSVRGRAESPRIEGTVTVVGGALNVDEILDRTLFRPYAVGARTEAESDAGAVSVLNPWDRLGMSITLRVPGTLRMVGEEVQITAGTPIGLGDVNVRVFGEVYLYKDPGDQLYVTGSLDSLTGTYTFQGRRFDIDPTSSINFHGDLNPELYITVQRLISAVDARVAIVGPLREPELRLTSNPPLEPSDILSLIVFGVPANLLTEFQQRDLAIRAGTLAAGFLAGPLVSALERTLGLEILEIEAPDDPRSGAGPRVTIGDELLPGLVARFSRQFGREEYDEATIEYSLSRILQIRATFSDAATLTARSPFRRTERAGIDLILFFSF